MTAPASETPTRKKLPLLQHFSLLADPRQSGKVLNPLDEIVLLLVCATIASCDDLVEIAEWGRERLDFLRAYLPYAASLRNVLKAGAKMASNSFSPLRVQRRISTRPGT